MKISDRRLAHRFNLTVPLRVRMWKSSSPEHRVESLNLSEGGVYFATDAPILTGAAVHLRLEMPREVTGHPTTGWRCTGHVVRTERITSSGSVLGIGVRFDYYEVALATER